MGRAVGRVLRANLACERGGFAAPPAMKQKSLASVSLAFAATSVLAFASDTSPVLDHSAPFLGRPLEIELSGAAPFAPVTLLLSPAAGHSQTPFGRLELRRERIIPVASGVTDAQGHWTASLPVPLDAALAELEQHYQALIFDPAAPAGAVLSNARALRLLGPRVYVSYRDTSTAVAHTGLYVVDAAHGSLAYALDHGPNGAAQGSNSEGRPVFDERNAVGAVMASAYDLVFFDAYFGTRLETIHFAAACSRVLYTDAARKRVYVLETGVLPVPGSQQPAVVHAFDLTTRSVVGRLSLSGTTDRLWCVGRAAREAFIAEHDLRGFTSLHRVSLDPLADRASVPLELEFGALFDRVAFAAGQVLVSSHRFGPFPAPASCHFSRVAIGASSMTVLATPMSDTYPFEFVALPGVDGLFTWSQRWTVPVARMEIQPLHSIGAPESIPLPDFYVAANDLEDDGPVLWVMDRNSNEPLDPTEPGRLWRLDLATRTWSSYPRTWPFEGPLDVERLRDPIVDLVCIGTRHVAPPIDRPGELLLASPSGAHETHVVLGVDAEALLAVPIP